MIIRFSKRDREEIDAVIEPLREEVKRLEDEYFSLSKEHFVIDEEDFYIPHSKKAMDLSNRRKEAIEKLWKATEELYTSIEDRRFKRIASSPQKILADAKAQTNAIVAQFITASKLKHPKISTEDYLRIQQEIRPLMRIRNSGTWKNIVKSEGDVTKLDAQQIIALIKKDLHRHYSRLESQDADTLTRYIEQTVSTALEKEPENAVYLMVTRDKILSTFIPAVIKKKRLADPRKGKTIVNLDGIRYEINNKGTKDMAKHMGLSAVMLLYMINAELTKHSNPERRTVSFPTIPFLELNGVNTTNKASVKTAIDRYRDGELTMLRTMTVSMEKTDEDNLPSFDDQSIIYRTRINKNRITVTVTPEYAAYHASVEQKEFIPLSFMESDGRSLNAFAVKLKLWENATMYRNIKTGQAEIISVWSLLKATNLPTIEQLGRKKSLWKKRIREHLEDALNAAISGENSEFIHWNYCKAKSQPLTSQERKAADSDYYAWSELYVSYRLKNISFQGKLIEQIEKNQETAEKKPIKKGKKKN